MEALLLIRPVVEAEGRQDKIEMGVGEWELLDGAIHEGDALSICPCRLSLFHHSGSGVHPDELSVRELLDHTAEELPSPTSHIENRFDGPGIGSGFADRRFLHWSEQEVLQNRAVIARRPAIEVGDVSILYHPASVGAANVHCKDNVASERPPE
jgi:hypothetical protein